MKREAYLGLRILYLVGPDPEGNPRSGTAGAIHSRWQRRRRKKGVVSTGFCARVSLFRDFVVENGGGWGRIFGKGLAREGRYA